MRKLGLMLVLLIFAGVQVVISQTITGKVTSADDGGAIPGATVVVKGTMIGVTTDLQGAYSLKLPSGAKVLQFSFVGMKTMDEVIGTRTVINVVLESEALDIEGVVVTALGITREKKSLGYATQQVTGEDLNKVKGGNFINNLSGKAAGVQVKSTGNMGGSTNVIIRGSSSITGSNQALIVVDGIPINNDNPNNSGQTTGRSGYDYGNSAADINQNDIESVNVLKGAAATALYGSRGANGVIMITTKKGTMGKGKRLGVNINSSITTGFVDKSTFPKYQQGYGAGYGAYYYGDEPNAGMEYVWDVNGDGITDLTVPTYEDASMGQKFDPSLLVYQWDSYDPASPNYHTPTPWVAAGDNGPASIFSNSLSLSNSIDVTGGDEKTAFRLGYTNMDEKGILPNSSLKKNSFLLNGSYKVLSNLKVSASANYVVTKGKGRNSTGYSDNLVSSFRQWSQTNVDYQMQKRLYDETGRNITWNPNNPFDLAPAYWDNPYFQRNENFETDQRDRLIGYAQVDWQINPHLSLMGRVAADTYNELQEERKEIGSSSGEFGVGRPDVTSGYSRFNKTFIETNMDLLLSYGVNLTEKLNMKANVGTNFMHNKLDQVFASTDGGLIVPGLYALSNSNNQMQAPEERLNEIGVNGYFAGVSFGYNEIIYVDGTFRYDQSSTLPKEKWSYPYFGVSTGFIFSNLMQSTNNWLSFGKLRLSYATVGNYAPWGSLKDTYTFNGVFGGTALYSFPNTKNNEVLEPENTKSLEGGVELKLFNNLLGFDLSLYQNKTFNQILPTAVSYATGVSSTFVNAGTMLNQGVEVMLSASPIKNGNFHWETMLNFDKNTNKVTELYGDLKNIQIASLQGGVTINARLDEAYGTIQGTDYVYFEGTNQKVVGANGYYLKSSTSDKILGNIQPDFRIGFNNKFNYKNWSASFLIDWQQGGSLFSLDMYYGLATGLYAETDYINDLGNPVRAPLTDDASSGGLIVEGVYADGTPNTTRVNGDDYRVFGYSRNPNATFVYDASYIKLREVLIGYSLPKSMFKGSGIQGVTFNLVGSNLWIMMKNLPHADPEASQSSGNIQGWQSGVMPSTRNVGFNINLQF